MKKSKYEQDLKRWKFRYYLLETKKPSTVYGYLSSLNDTSLINILINQYYGIDDVFKIDDLNILNELLKMVLTDKRNRIAHNRFSSALNYYILFVKTSKIQDERN